MPIRSPRGRATAYRSLWQWPLRSPARLGITVVAVVVLAAGAGVGAAAANGNAGNRTATGPVPTTAPVTSRAYPSSPAGASTSPTPTVLPPVPDLRPSTLPAAQAPAAALQVATRWTAAWVRPATEVTARQWLDGLRPTTTVEYLGVLAAVDPSSVPSTRVTGAAKAVQVAARSVQVQVPTDALTLLVRVVLNESGDWRVSGYDRA